MAAALESTPVPFVAPLGGVAVMCESLKFTLTARLARFSVLSPAPLCKLPLTSFKVLLRTTEAGQFKTSRQRLYKNDVCA
jgi:hypothetical protein